MTYKSSLLLSVSSWLNAPTLISKRLVWESIEPETVLEFQEDVGGGGEGGGGG